MSKLIAGLIAKTNTMNYCFQHTKAIALCIIMSAISLIAFARTTAAFPRFPTKNTIIKVLTATETAGPFSLQPR